MLLGVNPREQGEILRTDPLLYTFMIESMIHRFRLQGRLKDEVSREWERGEDIATVWEG